MTSASAPDAASKSHDDRRERFHKLQRRLRDSSSANRSDVIAEQVKHREASQRKSTAHAFQMAKAERILEDRDLLERGENIERHRAKTYTIEENEAWEKRLEEKERSRDKGMIGMSFIMKKMDCSFVCSRAEDFQDLAERSYLRQLKQFTPDRSAYIRQKEQEERQQQEKCSTSATSSHSRSVLSAPSTDDSDGRALVPAKDAPVSPAIASYGTHKPEESAVDRLVKHLNHEYVFGIITSLLTHAPRHEQIQRRSRRREDDLDVEGTYINQRNKRFNRKIQRVSIPCR